MSSGRGAAALLTLCLVLCLTALAYAPSLGNGFTNWDDGDYISGNGGIRDLSLTNLGRIFTSFQLGNYHPLTVLSYALEYRLFGLDPRGYHAVNLALHLFNTALVFLVVRLLGGALAASLAAALLFGVHPLHVESVAWISELKDVLCAFFFFGALSAYLRYQPGGRGRGCYLLSLALFIAALLSKSMAVTFPLVMLLCDWRFQRRMDRSAWIEKIPFLALAAGFGALAVISQGSSGSIRHDGSFLLHDGIFVASYGLVFYLVKTVLPLGLSALYPLPPGTGMKLPLALLLSPFAAAAVVAVYLRAARGSRATLFGGLFFLVTILPVLQLVPLGNAIVADRYIYIPSLGLCYLAGVWFARLAGPSAGRSRGVFPVAALAVVALALSGLTWQRTTVWKDSLTLWSDVIRKYPETASVAYGNRGIAYHEKGELDLAIRDYSRALEMEPGSTRALFNRGKAFQEYGDFGRAIADFTRALEADPGDTESAFRRGNLFMLQGESVKAISDFTRVLAAEPGRAEAWYNRGNARMSGGDPAGAMEDYGRAIGLKPDYAAAYNNRGAARAARGEYEPALADFARAVGFKPDYRGAYYNRGRLLEMLGRPEQAAADFARAGEPSPGAGGAPARVPGGEAPATKPPVLRGP